MFDPVAAAATAADHAVASLLQSEKLNRMAAAISRDADSVGPGEVIRGVVETAFGESEPALAEESAAIQEVVVRRLSELAASSTAAVTVRAAAEAALQSLPGEGGVGEYLSRAAARWLDRSAPGVEEARPAPDLGRRCGRVDDRLAHGRDRHDRAERSARGRVRTRRLRPRNRAGGEAAILSRRAN